MSERPRFLVIDDHPLFCEALRMALRAEFGAQEVDTASDLASGLEMLDAGGEIEAVLLDLNLPDVDGFEGLLKLKARHPRAPVVVVSGMADNRMIARALASGAAGFIPKDTGKEQLVAALRQVLDGDVYAPPGYAAPDSVRGAADPDDDAIGRLAELTPQQLRILELLCEGKLNKQIAYDLSIAETTVKAHITAILRKLKVQSRTQAVLVARKARYAEVLKS